MATSASSTYPAMRLFIRIRNHLCYHRKGSISMLSLTILICMFIKVTIFKQNQNQTPSYDENPIRIRKSLSKYDLKKDDSLIHVFQGHHGDNEERKLRVEAMVEDFGGMNVRLETFTIHQQRTFITEHGAECYPSDSHAVLKRYEKLNAVTQAHYRHELWKYCALAVYGGAYIDSESLLLKTFSDAFPVPTKNYAVIGSTIKNSIHGSIILLSEKKSPIALGMVQSIVETEGIELDSNPFLLQKKLYELISMDIKLKSPPTVIELNDLSGSREWTFMEQRCNIDVTAGSDENFSIDSYLPFQCPPKSGYCCEIIDPRTYSVVMITRFATLPTQYTLPMSLLQKPFSQQSQNSFHITKSSNKNIPFISTITENVYKYPDKSLDVSLFTPNFYEMLLKKECLPDDKKCSTCLRVKAGANCATCKEECSCYCDALCKEVPTKKFVRKDLYISLPPYRKDPSRLIPRIVHQTWYEPVTPEKYPNMSRLIESWKESGWEYRFYDDDAAGEFLSIHFPSEVRQAYDALNPGAFKADLFRYCTLLINGGVYADMDVMLESNLDAAISNDVGFMVPMDEPGTPANQRMCLWNGFIASAPGHPFLAQVVETVVNNIRNRFTSVDVDSTLCPAPELSVSHAFDTLFTAGPCVLGSSINFVLRRHLQTPYVPGDLDIHAKVTETSLNQIVSESEDVRSQIPGRSIILEQNKEDMGAHRFTWTEKNILVAATDMPDYDDRKNLEDNDEHEHYSKVHVRVGIYGLEGLYIDNEIANEDIKIRIKDRDELGK